MFSQTLSIFLHASHSHSHDAELLPFAAGILAAILHVIAGPDHLAAVTPIAIEAKKKVWSIGLLWGGGHLTGMLLIGLLFLGFQELLPLEAISAYSEQLVGLVLIGVGAWALVSLYLKRRRKGHAHYHRHAHIHGGETPFVHVHDHDHQASSHSHADATAHAHIHAEGEKTKQHWWASYGIGLLHGLAGIAHFILFLPVLGFTSTYSGVEYIVGFGAGTLLAMTFYTYLLGQLAGLTRKLHNPGFFQSIRMAGGLFAIVVGIYWMFINL